MPATAGRVRMPANNRVHSSAALQTHGIWQSAIGYDPYAPNKDESKSSAQPTSTDVEPEGENAYASFQGLLALARITGSNADEARGSCKKCGRVGHLTFQCRNFLSIKYGIGEEKDPKAIQAAGMSELWKQNGTVNAKNKGGSEEDSEEEDESESSDSDADSEMERLIAKRYGKKASSKGKSSMKESDEDADDSRERKKRGRSKKRRSMKRISNDSDEKEEDADREKREEKSRKKDDSSDEDQLPRRRKTRKEKSRRRKRKNRRAAAASDPDPRASDDSRIGRGTKRSEKGSRKGHHEVGE